MSGKDITTAASTVAVQEKAIFTPKYCKKKMPMGRFTPHRYKRKKPATVGGSTSGSVSTPSRRIFIRSFFMLTTHQAAMQRLIAAEGYATTQDWLTATVRRYIAEAGETE